MTARGSRYAAIILIASLLGDTALADPGGPAQAATGLEAAGWTLVSGSEETLVYMKHVGEAPGDGPRRVWTAYDSRRVRERGGRPFMSVRSLTEFDCERRLSREVDEAFHAAPGLTGDAWAPEDFRPTAWAAPKPGSVGELRFAFACGARGIPPGL